jgi:hypothetical protein
MSYLDCPRLVFFGDFQADVSTVNNDVRHYDAASFETRFQEFSQGATENGWWNPIGGAAFRLLNCRVRGATGTNGTAVTQDAVLDAAIGGSSDRVAAKMVDLDPQWQLSSQLWGLRIDVLSGDQLLLGGHFEPEGFRDIWFPARDGARHQLTARYTSVLEDVEWAAAGGSAFVDALREVTEGNRVSVRLVTFAYDTNHRSPRFTIGSVLGAIGPYRSGEPLHFVRGRRFAPKRLTTSASAPLVNFFDGQVTPEGDAVHIDVGNALPIADGTGALVDVGDIRLGLLANDALDEGQEVREGSDYVNLGEPIPYRTTGWLAATGGVVRASAPSDVQSELTERPLALIGPGPGGGADTVLIRETPGGRHCRADEDLHRVEAGESTTVSIYASRFGVPLAGAQVDVTLQPPQDGVGGGSPSAPNQPTAPIPTMGTPPSAVQVGSVPPTDEDGRTACTITCSDPRHPRGYLDGQLYQFTVGLAGDTDPRDHPLEAVSVLVFDAYVIPDRPTWVEHVRPILAQYGNLYPVMSQRLVNLGDYSSTVAHRGLLSFAFGLDIHDPNHMPVTRDLSRPKRATLLKWLQAPELGDGEVIPELEPPLTRRTLTLRAAAPAAPPSPVRPVSIEPKLEFVRGYLGLEEPPVDPQSPAQP